MWSSVSLFPLRLWCFAPVRLKKCVNFLACKLQQRLNSLCCRWNRVWWASNHIIFLQEIRESSFGNDSAELRQKEVIWGQYVQTGACLIGGHHHLWTVNAELQCSFQFSPMTSILLVLGALIINWLHIWAELIVLWAIWGTGWQGSSLSSISRWVILKPIGSGFLSLPSSTLCLHLFSSSNSSCHFCCCCCLVISSLWSTSILSWLMHYDCPSTAHMAIIQITPLSANPPSSSLSSFRQLSLFCTSQPTPFISTTSFNLVLNHFLLSKYTLVLGPCQKDLPGWFGFWEFCFEVA